MGEVGGRANTPNLFLIFVFLISLPGCLFVFVFPPIKVSLHCILPDIVVVLLNCTNIQGVFCETQLFTDQKLSSPILLYLLVDH